ncbi:hypothetical protein [Labilibacter marinus]|uniref:hypothetical protein n=1 Tax=Labilibacter marinus TaxID=1477105 RepID=UPI00094FBCE6|nr:hypothetical protein [Labilibacter marinus]
MFLQKKHLLNGFLLLIPIFIWNIALYKHLPKAFSAEVFWKDIPPIISYGENIFRILVFALPAFMMLSFKSSKKKRGLLIYLVGICIYFLSWLLLILYPESSWSNSLVGFTAPAFTTIIWFIGIGVMGNKAYFKIPKLTATYIVLSLIFVVFHTLHTYVVYTRLD